MNEYILSHVRYYDDGKFTAGSLHIKGASIAAIYSESDDLPTGVRIIDSRNKVVIPGMVNAHTHSHNILARGTLGASSLEVLIGNIDAANLGRTPEEAYAAAALNAIECLRGGATSVVDMVTTYPLSSEHLDAVGQAYQDVGIRALIVANYTDLSSYSGLPGFVDSLPTALRARIDASIEPNEVDTDILSATAQKWHNANDGRITFGLGPNVPHQCSDELLRATGELAAELGVPVHTHLAESRAETVSSQLRFSGEFVARLIDFGVLGEGHSAAHAIWLGSKDLGRLSSANATLVHCPASNLRLGAGVARVHQWERAGVSWAMGSDGAVSGDNLNMFEILRYAGLSSRIWTHDTSQWLSARQVLEQAFSGATTTLGSKSDLSGIRVGAAADLTVLDPHSSYLAPGIDLVTQLVFSETGASVSDVIVAGQFVVEAKNVVAVDEDRITQQVRTGGRAMMERNRDHWQLAATLRPYYDPVNLRAAELPWRPKDDASEEWSRQDLILPF